MEIHETTDVTSARQGVFFAKGLVLQAHQAFHHHHLGDQLVPVAATPGRM
jgi:hypothetical protein